MVEGLILNSSAILMQVRSTPPLTTQGLTYVQV